MKNVTALRQLVRRLLARPAARFSVSKFHDDLHSQGVAGSRDTVHEYLGHVEDAFLVHTVTVHSDSEKARQINPRKVYLADHGLARSRTFQADRDLGHQLENIVYLELRRRGYESSYGMTRSGFEVDFLAQRVTGEVLLVQVCADLGDPATRERELRALGEAMEELNLDRATLVTFYDEGMESLGRREVRVLPAWRWLLEGRG